MNSKTVLSAEEIWHHITNEAKAGAAAEPNFADYFAKTILDYEDLGAALSNHLAKKTSQRCRNRSNVKGDYARDFLQIKQLLPRSPEIYRLPSPETRHATSTALLFYILKGFYRYKHIVLHTNYGFKEEHPSHCFFNTGSLFLLLWTSILPLLLVVG